MKSVLLLVGLSVSITGFSQNRFPCNSDTTYRQFDFWIGEWEVYNLQGGKAGDSRISLILDSCIILEEWASHVKPGTSPYQGKSFNTYNSSSKQWQQTWVDNVGGSTSYVYGKKEGNKMEFKTHPKPGNGDTVQVQRLSFYHLSADKVRQVGEQSLDGGITWETQYDLEYRRKNNK